MPKFTFQFAVMDNDGNLFGLPARMFDTYEAAAQVLASVHQTREGLQKSAEAAKGKLALGSLSFKLSVRESLQDDVRRWEVEEPRTFSIVRRRVTAWETVA